MWLTGVFHRQRPAPSELKVPPTPEQLKVYLAEQFEFLRVSVGAFLHGRKSEALRIAVTIRVLVHKTGTSHPLLEMIDRKYRSIPTPDRSTTMPGLLDAYRNGRVGALMTFPVRTGGPVTSFDIDYGGVPLSQWWSEIPVLVVGDEKTQGPRTFTRKDLVLVLANRHGGAHVDPTGVPEHYARLVTDNPVRVSGSYSDSLDAARWTVAQSGAELGEALLTRWPELRELL